ncbi:MAG: hypothetical protein ACO3AF_01765 [Flavobacteriales bacterium]|jgi:hypothetical protein
MKRTIVLLAAALFIVAFTFSSCKSGDHCPAYGQLNQPAQLG